jgi:hypothetical protein
MANTLKFGSGQWATKVGSTLAYNDENGNFKPLPFNFTRSTSATRVNKDGLIEVVTNNKPRIDFLNDSNGALLLEPTRTNLITYSEDFTQGYWIKNNITINSNSVISPDGSLNATKLVEDNVSNSTFRLRSGGHSTSGDNTLSIFVKAAERKWIFFRENGETGAFAYFNVEDGTIGQSSSAENIEIKNFGNGWFKISFKDSLTFVGVDIRIALQDGVNQYNGDGTSGVYIWGAQIEQGSYATSYIPTQGATATRVDETCEQTPPSGIIGQTEGSIFAEFKSLNSVTNLILWMINPSGGLYGDMIKLDCGSDNRMRLEIREANVTSCNLVSDVLPTNIYYKLAVAYKQNDFVMYLNGVQIATDTSGNVPTCTRMYIGRYIDGGIRMGDVKSLDLYNTRLSNTELQALTSN